MPSRKKRAIPKASRPSRRRIPFATDDGQATAPSLEIPAALERDQPTADELEPARAEAPQGRDISDMQRAVNHPVASVETGKHREGTEDTPQFLEPDDPTSS